MSSSLIGSLRVALGLDTAQFEAGANKARGTARGLAKDIESSFKSAKIAVEGLVAAFAVGALTEQIKQSLQYAAAIGETASTLGVTTKQLQEFRFAAQQSGVAQEQLEGGLQRLAISMGKAEVGSQAQIKAFNAIGISVDQLKGKNTGDLFLMIADGLKNVTDRAQRAAIEVALFGKSGAQLDSVLSGGSARINALGQAAKDLGIVLDEDQIKNAEVTAHKLDELNTVLSANIASTVTANANSIVSLAQALSTLTSEVIKFLSSHPQIALAAIGALAGSRFGIAGAALGAAGGAFAGERVAENQADSNMDYAFRLKTLRDAEKEVARLRGQPQAGDTSVLGGLITLHHSGTRNVAGLQSAQAEVARQQKLLAQAGMAALAPEPGTPTGVNLPAFLAPKGPKGRKPPADRSDELLAQMDKEILQADQNILQAKLGLAGSNEENLQIQVQLIQLEKTIKDKAVDEELAKAEREKNEGKITAAALAEAKIKAQQLKDANAIEASIKLRAIVEAQLARAEQANFQLADQHLKYQEDALRVADSLATTNADHRRIQLAILDSEIAQQRLELQHEKDLAVRNGATAEEIKVIQDKLDHLDTSRAEGVAQILHSTQNPLQAWAEGIPKTADAMTEALQNIEVQGFDSLIDKIDATGDAFKHLGQTFLQEGQQIATMIIQLYLKMLLFRAISALGGFAGGVPSPDLGSAAGVNVGASFPSTLSTGAVSLPGLAGGGSFMVGGRGGTDMNVLSINGMPKFRVSSAEMVSVGAPANDAGYPPPVSIVTHIDATGADPAELSRVRSAVEQMNAEMPYRVVQAYYDAVNRNVIR